MFKGNNIETIMTSMPSFWCLYFFIWTNVIYRADANVVNVGQVTYSVLGSSQPLFNYSNSKMEIPEQCVKSIQRSFTITIKIVIKTPEHCN